MTTPVTTDSLTSGVAKYLISQTSVTSLVGSYPNTSPAIPFIWTLDNKVDIYANVNYNLKGSGLAGIVAGKRGTWLSPNTTNTARYQLISIRLFVDIIRDTDFNLSADTNEVERRAEQLFIAVDKVMHRPQGGAVLFGDVVTDFCIRLAEPEWIQMPDGDKMLYGEMIYGVETV